MFRRPVSSVWMASIALAVVGCDASPAPSQDAPWPTTRQDSGGSGGPGLARLPAALGGGTALAAFAPSTPPTQQHGYGALQPDRLDAGTSGGAVVFTAPSPPATADISAGAPPPGDQGYTGSCATWATGYSALGWWANHLGLTGATFAPMYLYSQVVKGACLTGMPIETPLDLLKSQGIDTQTDYEPNQYGLDCATQPLSGQTSNAAKFKITGYVRSDLTSGAKNAIMAAIAGGRPAVVALMVYPEFENASMTTYLVGVPRSGETSPGGHAVTAFAYDANGVWILNQWGSRWGYKGWAQLSWAFVDGSFGGQANVFDVATISGAKFSCTDANPQCAEWAFASQCQENPGYMMTNCCASCANPAPHFSASSQWYRIQNVGLGSGYSLDTFVVSPTGSYTGQYWKLSSLPSGRYRLTNLFQGDGASLDTTNGAVNVPEMAATGAYTGQFWTLTPVTNGIYRLTNDFLGPGRSFQASGDARDILLGTTAKDASQYWQISQIK